MQVNVLSYENGWDNGKETVFFSISVACQGQEYTIKRRFKRFDDLLEKLAKYYGNLPELPPKSMLKITKAVDLDKRTKALDRFLKDLVIRKDVFSERSLMEFLELDIKVPSLLNKGPNLLGKHSESRSILDLHYWEEAKMLFLVNADLSGFLQKSGLFSFGKKKEPTQTPGNVAGYTQGKSDPSQIGDYNFMQQWWMNYPSASTKAAWAPKLGLLVVGEDSGMMHFLKPNLANALKCEESFILKVHSDRLSAIDVDEERKLVYSVGEDRKFKVVDIDKKRISSEFECSGKKINCMFVDKEQRIAFVGDAEGNVKIIDLAKNPPTCVNNIRVNSKDSVVAIHVSSNLIFSACAESGKVYVHNVADPKNSVCCDNLEQPACSQILVQRIQKHHLHVVLERTRRAVPGFSKRRRGRDEQIRFDRFPFL